MAGNSQRGRWQHLARSLNRIEYRASAVRITGSVVNTEGTGIGHRWRYGCFIEHVDVSWNLRGHEQPDADLVALGGYNRNGALLNDLSRGWWRRGQQRR